MLESSRGRRPHSKYFLDNLPTVSREQVIGFLELAGEAVVAALDADSA